MRHDPDRRSFLARVAGGAFLVGAGLNPGHAAERQRRPQVRMVVDRDPRDPARLPPNPRLRPAPIPPPVIEPNAPPVSNHRITTLAPRQRFVVCPGHRRCPRPGGGR